MDPAARYKLSGWITVLIVIWIGYSGYTNTREDPALQKRSKDRVCGTSSGCVVERDTPVSIKRSVLNQQFVWDTSNGNVRVICRRGGILFGAWKCTPDDVPTPTVPVVDPGPLPSKVKRGAPR